MPKLDQQNEMNYLLKRRATVIETIAHAIKEKRLANLDENSFNDVERVLSIVLELFPATHPKTARGYARAAIILSKKHGE